MYFWVEKNQEMCAMSAAFVLGDFVSFNIVSVSPNGQAILENGEMQDQEEDNIIGIYVLRVLSIHQANFIPIFSMIHRHLFESLLKRSIFSMLMRSLCSRL